MNLAFLRGLYDHPGPWASVYLDVSRDTEDAAHAVELRWRHCDNELAMAGVPDEVRGVVAEAVTADVGRPDGPGLALFAAAGVPVRAEPLPRPPRHQIARWAPLPHAMPLVVQQTAAAAHRSAQLDTTLDRYHTNAEKLTATGLAGVVPALAGARVDTLLLVDDASSTAHLWIGPEPTHLATSAHTLHGEGVTEPQRERADAALVRALAATDAELVLVPADRLALTDGLGAILRY